MAKQHVRKREDSGNSNARYEKGNNYFGKRATGPCSGHSRTPSRDSGLVVGLLGPQRGSGGGGQCAHVPLNSSSLSWLLCT